MQCSAPVTALPPAAVEAECRGGSGEQLLELGGSAGILLDRNIYFGYRNSSVSKDRFYNMASKRKSSPIKLVSEDFLFPTKRSLLSPVRSVSCSSSERSSPSPSTLSDISRMFSGEQHKEEQKKQEQEEQEQEIQEQVQLRAMLFKIYQFVSEQKRNIGREGERKDKPPDLSLDSSSPSKPLPPSLLSSSHPLLHPSSLIPSCLLPPSSLLQQPTAQHGLPFHFPSPYSSFPSLPFSP